MTADTSTVRYGDKVLTVEPFGVEQVQSRERHGTAKSQFTLWLGCNLTIADYALGFLPIALGMPWGWTIAAILVGNVLGALALALCSAMGPTYGVPQLIISRFAFGRIGGYLPGLLNYVSTIGWFTVNNILGAFGLQVLFPGLKFWEGAVILVIIQGLLAIYGYNLIHVYEKIMSVVLGVMFILVTIIALSHSAALAAYHPTAKHPLVLFAIMVAAAFSYIGSWGPYASDYSRYLRRDTPKKRIIGWSFLGSFVASVWLELVGVAVAILAGAAAANPISALHGVMGGFGAVSVIAIILGGTAADAINLYSNALCAGAIDIRLPRWALAIGAAIIGLVLSLLGSGAFEANYENFLLLIGYWITPWMGVLFADFYLRRAHRHAATDARNQQAVYVPGLVSYLIGIAVSIPFMSSTLYTGPVATALGGADLTFYVGFAVSMVVYLAWSGRQQAKTDRVG